jgi:CelD/BcsL family acetyltransferase involved in cellulose biosynthesis
MSSPAAAQGEVFGFASTQLSKVRTSFVVRAARSLADVECAWRALERRGLQSPGQSFAFVKAWVASQAIPEAEQLFLIAEADGAPVALMPLHRRTTYGLRLLTWFPGSHVGCNAPLVDAAKLASYSAEGRTALWEAMLAKARNADLLYLKSIPRLEIEGIDVFAELGEMVDCERVYRAEYGSGEAAAASRSKSRRKHDRQQGDKLEALGAVSFQELRPGQEAREVLDLMFRQRTARFRTMGVVDPFACPKVRGFYESTVSQGTEVETRLHVLRLNDEVVAVRYNILQGSRLFCLISSMSEDCSIQVGSPGKQCLLRVMQTVFDNGISSFDMGAGMTDEKRHWCNVELPLRSHYVPLTAVGLLGGRAHRSWQKVRVRIKTDPRLLKAAKALRSVLNRSASKGTAAEVGDA